MRRCAAAISPRSRRCFRTSSSIPISSGLTDTKATWLASLRSAMCGGDFAALEAMLHDELLYTHSSGLTDTKATWLASLRSGKTKYKSATCSDRKVRLAGDTALVTGRAAIEAEINGQPRSLRLVFLNAWTKTPKGWKFIAWQSTPQPTT